MEFNKSVSNPMLVGSIELLKAEDTPEHRNMFVAELQKASLLSPALIEPAPVEDAEGNLTVAPDSSVQFPMLTASDGKRFFVGFTDMAEYEKWKEKNKDFPFFALRFEDYAGMLFRKDARGNLSPALGFVINPYGANLVVPKEMVAGIMAAKVAQAQKQAGSGPQQKLHINIPKEKPGSETDEQ